MDVRKKANPRILSCVQRRAGKGTNVLHDGAVR